MRSTGFLYIAYGKKYQLEAQRSARSLLKQMPGAEITLITHTAFDAPEFSDVIVKPMQGSYMDKVRNMQESPYDRTMFLDTDTYICEDLSLVFGLLDHFEIAMAVEEQRPNWKELPPAFNEMTGFNTGVVLFNKCSSVEKLFAGWESIYRERQDIDAHDQISLDIAFTRTTVNFTVLPSEFNLRVHTPQILDRKVHIIHGRLRDIERTVKLLNTPLVLRSWLPSSQRCVPIYGNKIKKLITRIKFALYPIMNRMRNLTGGTGDLILPDKDRFEE